LIEESSDDLNCVRNSQLRKRPGDIPEFLERIEYAKECQKKKIFKQSFELIFGRTNGC
jgi:general secretion pathway protein D